MKKRGNGGNQTYHWQMGYITDMSTVRSLYSRSSDPHLQRMCQSDIISSKPFLPSNIILNHTVDNNPSHKNEINALDKEECILQFFLPQVKNYKTATGTIASTNHVLATAWTATRGDRLVIETISNGAARICIVQCSCDNQDIMRVIYLIWDGIGKSTSSLAYDGALAVVALVTHGQSNRNH